MKLAMKATAYGSIAVLSLGLIFAAVFYFESAAENSRIDQQQPTYTHFDPVTKQYTDYKVNSK